MYTLSARFWLLLVIAVLAYPAIARVVQRTLGFSLPGMTVTQNRKLEQRRLTFSLIWLALLAAFTIFTFSQTAADLVHSPKFPSLLMVACTAIGLYFTVRGAITGRVEPMSKGSFGPYDRVKQPWRYWLSMAWNGLFTAMCGFLILKV